MGYLFSIGRVFYGISIAVLGLLTVFYADFPYMLVPPTHFWRPGLVGLTFISGVMLAFSGFSVAFAKKPGRISVILGALLLLVFVFYFIPYELLATQNYMHFGEWENAEKEFALAAGACIMASGFAETSHKRVIIFLNKLIPIGTFLFSATMISFGIAHFVYEAFVLDYIPSWVRNHLFWNYVAGSALICSGLAIILNIKRGLAAVLLGAMIFTWFIVLHMPRVIASPFADLKDEVTSAFIALAYSGTALAIAGVGKRAGKRPLQFQHFD
jgi:hypothetical protein